MRSGPDGRFRFRYAPSGVDDALYFVSSRHQGIAYFSPPLRAIVVRGGDADIIVYDTTSDTTILLVPGRHLVVSAPRGSKRQVAEVFEIENLGTRTVVARDSTSPLWTTHLPARAESASVAPGDISAGAVAFRPTRVEVFAPVSPGVRQLVVTYLLPADAFPLQLPVERPVSVLEVLLEEPRADADGARLTEVAPATIEGRTFRRFLARDVPATEVIRVSAPPPVGRNRAAMRVLAVVMALAMLVAIAAWRFRRHDSILGSEVRGPRSEVDVLIATLATLDSRFEKVASPDTENRAEYERERSALKDRIARTLAAEKTPA